MNEKGFSIEQIEAFLELVDLSYQKKYCVRNTPYGFRLMVIRKMLERIYKQLIKRNLNLYIPYGDDFLYDCSQFIKESNQKIYGYNEMRNTIQKENSYPMESNLDKRVDTLSRILSNWLVISDDYLYFEKDLESHLSSTLKRYYGTENVKEQYSIGGFLGLKTDIDLFNGEIGIELKIYDHLSASELQRLIGQVVYYTNRVYKERFIVFIVGRNEPDAIIKELSVFLKAIGGNVIYKKSLPFESKWL
ncbi:MAG: hypothetical protein H7A23_00035 [Leptospiraceae bacterium]|nr:hypothetical protein [Leptospiraceae bacterium]